MKPKIKNTIIAILVLLSVGLTIRTCKLQKDLNSSQHSVEFLMAHPIKYTDTVYKESKHIQSPKAFTDEVKPLRVIIPKESQTLVSESSNRNASGEVIDNGLSSRDSLIGINLNRDLFTFTFQNPTFGNHQSEFKIKPQEYQYTWVDGKLTAKRLSVIKRLELKPYASLSYRPINNLWDIEGGISFKTKSLNYNLGLNAFYYPQWQSKPGWDAIIRITYNF